MKHEHKSGKNEEVLRVGEYGIFFKRPYQIRLVHDIHYKRYSKNH
ncbi:hypothetical protein [Terribacillus aidingensis]